MVTATTPQERRALELFRSATPEGQEYMLALAADMASAKAPACCPPGASSIVFRAWPGGPEFRAEFAAPAKPGPADNDN